MAGSEDQLAYNAVTSDRQNIFCSPLVLRLFEIMQQANLMPGIEDTYVIKFPMQQAMSETQEIDNNYKKAQTLKEVVLACKEAGGSIDIKSAFANVGLQDIKVDKLPDLDEDNAPQPGEEDGSEQRTDKNTN